MTKEEVNRKHILRQEGKETNLIEERNRVLFENEKKEKVPKEKTSKANHHNPFGRLSKKECDDHSEDDHSEEEVEVDDGVRQSYDIYMNYAEKV